MPNTLPALTLWPEWAFAITDLGKRVENRPQRVCRVVAKTVGKAWLALHAGKHVGGRPGFPALLEGRRAVRQMSEQAGLGNPWAHRTIHVRHGGDGFTLLCDEEKGQPVTLHTSTVVAVVRVGGVLLPGRGGMLWQVPSSWALKLGDVHVLPRPVPCKGAQGVWRLPEDVHQAVVEQLEQLPSDGLTTTALEGAR